MISHLSSWKMPHDSPASVVRIHLHSFACKRITHHLTVFASFHEYYPPSSSSPKKSRELEFSSPRNNGKVVRGLAENNNTVASSITVEKKTNSHQRRRKLSLKKLLLLFGSKKSRSLILLNVICVVYASNIAVIKDVEAFTDPAYFSAVRFVTSVIPLLPFIVRARDDDQTRKAGLELGLWISLGYLSEALGLLTSDAGRASFISLFTVIVIPLLELMFGEIVPARTWFGVFMSVLGIAMLESSGSPPNIGDLFNFLSAIFFGIHTLRTEHISRTTKKENFLALLGYEVAVVAFLSIMWCLMGENPHENKIIVSWDEFLTFPWIPALYTGVFSTGLCLWGEIAAMREVSATETAVIYGLEPLWGAAFAWFLLGERWGFAGWIGAALILCGSLTVQMFGASGNESKESSSSEVNKDNKEKKLIMLSEEKKTLTASPVMVRSRDHTTSNNNNMMDLMK